MTHALAVRASESLAAAPPSLVEEVGAFLEELLSSDDHVRTENAGMLVDAYKQGELRVELFQREGLSWGVEEMTQFILSMIRRIPIPAIVVRLKMIGDKEHNLLVDGQQRMTTLYRFVTNQFALSTDPDCYPDELSRRQLAGKTFSEICSEYRRRILKKKMHLHVLPATMSDEAARVAFQIMNKAGATLSAQDIRATMAKCPVLCLITAAGIRQPALKNFHMLLNASLHGVGFPWQDASTWRVWWGGTNGEGTEKEKDQTPARMILEYFFTRMLLSEPGGTKKLPTADPIHMGALLERVGATKYRDMDPVLDRFYDQWQADYGQDSPVLIGGDVAERWFRDFERWFNYLVGSEQYKITLAKDRRLAQFIGVATSIWKAPSKKGEIAFSEEQKKLIQQCITGGGPGLQTTHGWTYPGGKGKVKSQMAQIAAMYRFGWAIAAKGGAPELGDNQRTALVNELKTPKPSAKKEPIAPPDLSAIEKPVEIGDIEDPPMLITSAEEAGKVAPVQTEFDVGDGGKQPANDVSQEAKAMEELTDNVIAFIGEVPGVSQDTVILKFGEDAKMVILEQIDVGAVDVQKSGLYLARSEKDNSAPERTVEPNDDQPDSRPPAAPQRPTRGQLRADRKRDRDAKAQAQAKKST